MMDKKRIVIDTTAVISYFDHVFDRGSQISSRGLTLIHDAFEYEDKIILVIPSIVFIEIFDKWFSGSHLKDEEFRAMFLAEVFQPICRSPNMEIREIDDEVIEEFLLLSDEDIGLEQHDRIILAHASVLDATLITSDGKIIAFQDRHHKLPSIIS